MESKTPLSEIEIPDTTSERFQKLKESGEVMVPHPNDPVNIYLL
jgi:hypothetical protein